MKFLRTSPRHGLRPFAKSPFPAKPMYQGFRLTVDAKKYFVRGKYRKQSIIVAYDISTGTFTLNKPIPMESAHSHAIILKG